MAVVIHGSGTTPVVGSRDITLGTSGGITISGAPSTGQIAVWTGSNSLEGTSSLTFVGGELTITGNTTISGTLAAEGLAQTVTNNVLYYNTSTGAITYNATGGGGYNFLRADGTWTTPVSYGSSYQIPYVIGGNAFTYDSDFTYNGSYFSCPAIYVGSTSQVIYESGSNLIIQGGNAITINALSAGGTTIQYNNGTKSIAVNSSAMTVTDTADSVGLQYAADYSTAGAAVGNRWIPDKGYVDSAIAAQISAVSTGYLIATKDIAYDDASMTGIIITLPDDAVVWDVNVEVTETFANTAVYNLDIGITSDQDHFVVNEDLEVATGFTSPSVNNTPYKCSGSTNIEYTQEPGDTGPGDSTAGAARLYVFYSTH